MTSRISYRLTAILVTLSLLLAPWQQALQARPAPATHAPETAAPTDDGAVYLPVLRRPVGPPSFEIISPRQGWTISGMLFFAVQAVHTESVDEVTFLADGTELGTDVTAEDGYRVFLDGDAFPAGELNLTAVATGPAGETSKTVTVNVEADPPSSATLGAAGGTLETETGSIITFPPGSVAPGATITVTERTQDEVTAENGIDWEALGVTFLGDQLITASSPFSLPLPVASAGFGNRVQPGQAVVNYTIAPDANGDGVDELVVINSASVAPDNSVISDPVPPVQIVEEDESYGPTGVTLPQSNGIEGPPGTRVEVEVQGLNSLSLQGNVAVWRSSVDGETVEMPGSVGIDPADTSRQIFSAVIPSLTPGPATLFIHNESTSSVAGPLDATVQEPSPLSRPADEIVLTFVRDAITYLNNVETTMPEEEEAIAETVALLDEALATLESALGQELTPQQEEALQEIALFIENASFYDVPPSSVDGPSAPTSFSGNFGAFVTGTGAVAAGAGMAANAAGWAAAAGAFGTVGTAASLAGGVLLFCQWYYDKDSCFEGADVLLPEKCKSTAGSPEPGDLPIGMGGAVPPGGDSCGDVIIDWLIPGYLGTGPTLPGQVESGRFTIKVVGVPFSGVADPGNYFYVPFLPEGEEFTAFAFDTLTGEIRMARGVGPPTGESVFLLFDFIHEDNAVVRFQHRDVVTGAIESSGALSAFAFDGTAGANVYARMAKTSGDLIPAFELVGPDGSMVCAASAPFSNLADTDCTLDTDGVHIIFARDDRDENTGSFALQLLRTDAPAGPAPLPYGASASGVISPAVQMDSYTVDGAAGDSVIVRAARTAGDMNPALRLYRPDGSLLCDARAALSLAEAICLLDVDGAHTLLLGSTTGTETGEYSAFVQRINGPAGAQSLSFGETITETVEPAAVDAYTFSGAAGDELLFRTGRIAGQIDLELRIFRPDGTEVCGASTSGAFLEETCTLDATGQHTLFVGDIFGVNGGSYQLYGQQTDNPAGAVSLAYGDTVGGSVNPAVEMEAYTFTGAEGDVVDFQVTQTVGELDPEMRVYRPDGTLLCEDWTTGTTLETTCTLDTAGTHLILIADFGGTDTGDYELLIDLSN